MTVREVSVPYIGGTLPNGATVVGIKQVSIDTWIVLAIAHPGTKHGEYVTWVMSPDGFTYSGRYFHDLGDAVADYNERG